MFATIRQEIKSRGEYRLGNRGSFWRRFALSHWRWAVTLCHFEEEWALHLFCFWITLCRSRTEPAEMLDRWGVDYDGESRSLHLSWGARTKVLWMPWMYDHCRTEVMLEDGSFVPYERYRVTVDTRRPIEENPEPMGRYRRTFPYAYTLRSGEVQRVEATVTVERRTWWWRGLRWLPVFKWANWPRRVRTSIDIDFSEEVGERRGSWKGGTVGCGWDLLTGETPEQCLRRMECERQFN